MKVALYDLRLCLYTLKTLSNFKFVEFSDVLKLIIHGFYDMTFRGGMKTFKEEAHMYTCQPAGAQ